MKRFSNTTNYWKNANKNHNEVSPHTGEGLSSKSLHIINAEEGVEKRESSCTVGGNESWCTYYENQYGVFLKKNWN